MSTVQERIKRARDLFNRIADKIGVPNASEFKTEADADAALGPKLEQINSEFQSACSTHGLTGEAWDVAMPPYMEAKGWTVEHIDGAWTIVTADVEKK